MNLDENDIILIRYRLDRANEVYDEAIWMAEKFHYNTCVNRLYYSCFYAVNALLMLNGISVQSHKGTKIQFNHIFIKNGIAPKEFGLLYNQLFESRQEGDYVDFVKFEYETVLPWIEQVKEFLIFTENFINDTLNK
jgi:uncharacterized protein (UPF0332 family)